MVQPSGAVLSGTLTLNADGAATLQLSDGSMFNREAIVSGEHIRFHLTSVVDFLTFLHLAGKGRRMPDAHFSGQLLAAWENIETSQFFPAGAGPWEATPLGASGVAGAEPLRG